LGYFKTLVSAYPIPNKANIAETRTKNCMLHKEKFNNIQIAKIFIKSAAEIEIHTRNQTVKAKKLNALPPLTLENKKNYRVFPGHLKIAFGSGNTIHRILNRRQIQINK
jgi:hypothetical protein